MRITLKEGWFEYSQFKGALGAGGTIPPELRHYFGLLIRQTLENLLLWSVLTADSHRSLNENGAISSLRRLMLAVSDSLINESGDPIRPKKGRIVTSNELEQWRRYCELLNRIKNSEEYMDVDLK